MPESGLDMYSPFYSGRSIRTAATSFGLASIRFTLPSSMDGPSHTVFFIIALTIGPVSIHLAVPRSGRPHRDLCFGWRDFPAPPSAFDANRHLMRRKSPELMPNRSPAVLALFADQRRNRCHAQRSLAESLPHAPRDRPQSSPTPTVRSDRRGGNAWGHTSVQQGGVS